MSILWVVRPTRFSQQLQLLFESIEDRGPWAKYFVVSYVEQFVFKRDVSCLKNEKSRNCGFAFCRVAVLLFVCRRQRSFAQSKRSYGSSCATAVITCAVAASALPPMAVLFALCPSTRSLLEQFGEAKRGGREALFPRR